MLSVTPEVRETGLKYASEIFRESGEVYGGREGPWIFLYRYYF
jgi:hypothetical protein